jgi:hypothetical protein
MFFRSKIHGFFYESHKNLTNAPSLSLTIYCNSKEKLVDFVKFFVAFLENITFKNFDQNYSIVEILRST